MRMLGKQLVARHNPFCFIMQNYTTMDFADWLKCYEFTLLEIYKSSQRGFFDFVLFLTTYTTMTVAEAERFAKSCTPLGLPLQYGFVLIDWTPSKQRDNLLEIILRCLHELSETKLNQDIAKEAIRLFDASLEVLKTAPINDRCTERLAPE